MRKEKPKKKVDVNVVMDWIVKLLVAVTILTIAGMVVVMALPISASLKTTCAETAVFAFIIEATVLAFVVNIAINVEFNEMDKKLQELEHNISSFIDYLKGDN